jgi:hypothetical protein
MIQYNVLKWLIYKFINGCQTFTHKVISQVEKYGPDPAGSGGRNLRPGYYFIDGTKSDHHKLLKPMAYVVFFLLNFQKDFFLEKNMKDHGVHLNNQIKAQYQLLH